MMGMAGTAMPTTGSHRTIEGRYGPKEMRTIMHPYARVRGISVYSVSSEFSAIVLGNSPKYSTKPFAFKHRPYSANDVLICVCV